MALDNESAALIFLALGHSVRLDIFRTLIKVGQKGLSVGEIQLKIDLPGSTLSHHLSCLKRAKLIQKARSGTKLTCSINYKQFRELLAFLKKDCCIDDVND